MVKPKFSQRLRVIADELVPLISDVSMPKITFFNGDTASSGEELAGLILALDDNLVPNSRTELVLIGDNYLVLYHLVRRVWEAANP